MAKKYGKQRAKRAKINRGLSSDIDLGLFVKSLEQKSKKAGQRPGQAAKRRPPASQFGEQQEAVNSMVGYYYIRGGQFRSLFNRAKKMNGSTDEMLIQLLESRLDSVVFTMGFGVTKRQCRQMVVHKHITVNGSVVSCPAYHVRPGDVIAVKNSAKEHQRVAMSVELARDRKVKEWVDCDYESLSGTYKFHPSLKHIHIFDPHLLGHVIVYFSK